MAFLDSFYDINEWAQYRGLLKKAVIFVDDESQVKTVLDHEVIRESLPHSLVIDPTKSDRIDIWSATETLTTESLIEPIPVYNRFLLDRFEFDEDKPILPLIKNLKGKEVKIAGITYRPYTYYEFVEPGTGNAHSRDSGKKFDVKLDGTEFMILLQFCQLYNCTLNLELGKSILREKRMED